MLLGIGLVFISSKGNVSDQRIDERQDTIEVESVDLTDKPFDELYAYFQKLAQDEGAEYAYATLRSAELSPNIDVHLLGHVIGDELYAQQKLSGMHICTQEFRNACSHSIVVGEFLLRGEGAIDTIKKACHEAPGGSGAYTMCFHGLGHGVLAYHEYDVKKAVGVCKQTGTAEFSNREIAECIGGVLMELISGGAHDKDAWEGARNVYLKHDDPLYPCNDDLIPDLAREMCYSYITPHLIAVSGGNLGDPYSIDYSLAFAYCDDIPPTRAVYRDACYGGFGKEFVVFARDRDVREFAAMSDDEMRQALLWCSQAGGEFGEQSCIRHATNSLFWGGENDRSIAIRFCELVENDNLRSECFVNLIGNVYYYIDDEKYVQEFCREIPAEYHDQCINRL